MGKKVNIIGAGLAGLSAGIYLQQSGIETEIFELADWAGGMCTAWVRKGFRFDGCIHWMVGTKPEGGFNALYREVGALEEDTIIYNAESLKFEIEGVSYEVPLEITQFKALLHSLSPQDSERIEELCKDIKRMIDTKMPTSAPSNPVEVLKMMGESRGFISVMGKYRNITVGEYIQSFQSDVIKMILDRLMSKEYAMQALIMMLGARMSDNAGYPMGGALDMIKRMEAKYYELGGRIHFHSKVEEIMVENGKAIAIRAKGILYPGDAVIAACDAYDTLHNMLKGQYKHKQLDDMLKNTMLFPPLALVSFGLNRSFNLPYSSDYECPEGILIDLETKAYGFNLRSFEFDPTAAPENCSSVMIMMQAPLEYWKNLRENDREGYKKRKEQLAEAVTEVLERHIPGFKEAIVVTDIATPATYVRIANLYKGSFEGFAPTPAALKKNISKTVPKVKNLILCGQWTDSGGGICMAIKSGKDAAHLAVKSVKK